MSRAESLLQDVDHGERVKLCVDRKSHTGRGAKRGRPWLCPSRPQARAQRQETHLLPHGRAATRALQGPVLGAPRLTANTAAQTRASNPVLKIPIRFNLHPARGQRPGRLGRAKTRTRVPSRMLRQRRASARARAAREASACPEVCGPAGKGLSHDVILGMTPI